jgi:hypothetical protein
MSVVRSIGRTCPCLTRQPTLQTRPPVAPLHSFNHRSRPHVSYPFPLAAARTAPILLLRSAVRLAPLSMLPCASGCSRCLRPHCCSRHWCPSLCSRRRAPRSCFRRLRPRRSSRRLRPCRCSCRLLLACFHHSSCRSSVRRGAAPLP